MISPSRIAVTVLLFALAGCRSSQTATTTAHSAAQHYHLAGTVVAVNAAAGELTVKHGAIPGFMPAMTMPYKLKDAGRARDLKPGDSITAEVVAPAASDDFVLDQITVTAHGANGPVVAARRLGVGDAVPDVPLVNQDGQAVHLRDYRGRALLLTFIYTRCPMPTACPLITSRFARVNRALLSDAAARTGSHLLSISLDPAFDKPPVLRHYGLAYINDDPAGFAHWEFAATTPEDLRGLAQSFGLEYSVADNQITHTMQTVLIAPDGTVARSWAGSGWNEDEVAAAVKSLVPHGGR
jgi:protein SCO1/2